MEAGCYAVDLGNPQSPSSIAQVKKKDGELAINVHTDNKICLELSGAFDGGVVVRNQKNVDVDLVLKGVRITSEGHAGYLELKSNDKNIGNTYRVELVGKSEIVGAADKKSKSVISCGPNLVFVGDGELAVTAKYKNGIVSDDVVVIESGNILVKLDRAEAAKGEKYKEKGFGIKADNGFEMRGGKVTIEANDNITGYESRGIKVDGSDKTSYGTGKGFVKISGGELVIHSDAKALSAGWDRDEDAKTAATEDDPHPDVLISGGVIDIVTSAEPRGGRKFGPPPEMQMDENGNPVMPDFMQGGMGADGGQRPDFGGQMPDFGGQRPDFGGMAADGQMGKDSGMGEGFGVGNNRRPSPNKKKDKSASGDNSETTVSSEGIEAKRNLIISGGKIRVKAMDDGINAGESIEISGGEVRVWSVSNDALDANGHATISGGLTVLFGTGDPDGGLDADVNRNVTYTGGTLFALGGVNNAPEGQGTTGTFAQVAIIESKGGPGMVRDMNRGKAPDSGEAMPSPEGMPGMGSAPGEGAGFDPFNRKREKSELADKILSLADPEDGKSIVSIKVPGEYTGGGSVIVLSEKLQSGRNYRVYTNPNLGQPINNWVLDAISEESVQVSGEQFKEVSAGVALPSPFGTMPNQGKPGLGGNDGAGVQ